MEQAKAKRSEFYTRDVCFEIVALEALGTSLAINKGQNAPERGGANSPRSRHLVKYM